MVRWPDADEYTDCPECEGEGLVPGPCEHYGNMIITPAIACPFCGGAKRVTNAEWDEYINQEGQE